MYKVQCAVCNVQLSMKREECAVYKVQFAVCSDQCAAYREECKEMKKFNIFLVSLSRLFIGH